MNWTVTLTLGIEDSGKQVELVVRYPVNNCDVARALAIAGNAIRRLFGDTLHYRILKAETTEDAYVSPRDTPP